MILFKCFDKSIINGIILYERILHMKKVGFLIINYNDYKTTIKLVDNIKNYKVINEIVVIDNNSTDDSVKELKKIKEITLINNDRNYGFAKAINIGSKYLIKKYKECFIFISNSDIRITSEDDIKELLNTFRIKDVAVVGPVIQEPCGISRGWKLTSVFEDILINIPLVNRLYRNKLITYNDDYYHGKITYVDMVKGCFFVIDSKALEKVNFFDENTFLYYEENILAQKLKQKKYTTVVNNKVTVFHDHAVTISKNVNNINRYKITKESMMYYEKNYNNASKFSLGILKLENGLNLLFKKIRK